MRIAKFIDKLPDGADLIIATVAVFNKDGDLLLVRRPEEEESNPGVWEVPGGHIEEGETPEEAAIREAEESVRTFGGG